MFAKGFVDLKTWWIAGFIVSMLMVLIYMTVGVAYWKLIAIGNKGFEDDILPMTWKEAVE